MDNLAICKKISEIKGLDFTEGNGKIFYKKDWETLVFNPFDNDLNHQLMIEYDVNIDRDCDSAYILSDYTDKPHKAIVSFAVDMNINKAILLCIIESKKEL